MNFSICKLCEIETENMIHFLLKCIVLEPVRKQYIHRLNDIQAEMSNIKLTDMSEENQLQILLDNSVLYSRTKQNEIILSKMEIISRQLIYIPSDIEL